jgi:hypothetical protein
MLNGMELRLLASWSSKNRLSWMPAGSQDGRDAVMLQPRDCRSAFERMLLIPDDDGFSLVQEDGQVLAAASDLPALMDALDGGIAEPEQSPVGTYYGVGRRVAAVLQSPAVPYVV